MPKSKRVSKIMPKKRVSKIMPKKRVSKRNSRQKRSKRSNSRTKKTNKRSLFKMLRDEYFMMNKQGSYTDHRLDFIEKKLFSDENPSDYKRTLSYYVENVLPILLKNYKESVNVEKYNITYYTEKDKNEPYLDQAKKFYEIYKKRVEREEKLLENYEKTGKSSSFEIDLARGVLREQQEFLENIRNKRYLFNQNVSEKTIKKHELLLKQYQNELDLLEGKITQEEFDKLEFELKSNNYEKGMKKDIDNLIKRLKNLEELTWNLEV